MIKCPRCNGKGAYWTQEYATWPDGEQPKPEYIAPFKEKCILCKGEGKIPKEMKVC